MIAWRAGCGESRTSGSESGPQKPTSRNADRALRPDFYTYVPTLSGFGYLATVLDVYSRRIVGWSQADHMRTSLIIDAVDMAVDQRKPARGLIHHSDQGTQAELNWSSQHFDVEVCDGKTSRVDGRVDGAVANEVAWSAFASA